MKSNILYSTNINYTKVILSTNIYLCTMSDLIAKS